MSSFTSFMDQALAQARLAAEAGDVPVGAVIVLDSKVVAKAHNRMRASGDPTAHAEILAIRAASENLGERLSGADLYVTLEPCAMCAGAIANARIARLYFAASDPKSGGVLHGARVFDHPQCHHKPEIYDGISAREAEEMLKTFFQARR